MWRWFWCFINCHCMHKAFTTDPKNSYTTPVRVPLKTDCQKTDYHFPGYRFECCHCLKIWYNAGESGTYKWLLWRRVDKAKYALMLLENIA